MILAPPFRLNVASGIGFSTYLCLPILLYKFRFGTNLNYDTLTLRTFYINYICFLLVSALAFSIIKISRLNKNQNLIIFGVLSLLYFWFPLYSIKNSISATTTPDEIHVSASPYLRETEGAKLVYPELKFLWQTDSIDQFPNQKVLLITIIIFIIAVSAFRFVFNKKSLSNFLGIPSFLPLCILIPSILHTGLLSPYSTNYFYSRALDYQNRWYTIFIVNESQGAVNADYFVFRNLDYIFWGPLFDGSQPDGLLIRRSIMNYVLSTPNYLFNSYYTWLITNSILILITSFLTYRLLIKFCSPKSTTISVFTLATSLPILLYFGSPWTYLSGVLFSVILVLLFFDFFLINPNNSKYKVGIFGLYSIFASLSYDQIPILLSLLFFSIILVRKKLLIFLLAVSLIFPSLFSYFYILLGGAVGKSNVGYISQSLEKLLSQITGDQWPNLLSLFFNGIFDYPEFLTKAFGLHIVLLSFIGILLTRQINIKLLIIVIQSIGLMTYLFFYISNSELINYPRIFFHPLGASIISFAIAIDAIFNALLKIKWHRGSYWFLSSIFTICLILWGLFLGNSDLFGNPHYILGIQFNSIDNTSINWRESDLSWEGKINFKD